MGRAPEDADARRDRCRSAAFVDERTGGAPFARKALRYLFPDHWSFLLGEVALYCFVVLVATGIYLALLLRAEPRATTVYHGPYVPLQGTQMSEAYRSVVDISFDVKAGLLIRQTHHWAADVFVAAIVAAPAAGVLHGRLPQAARADLPDRRADAVHSPCSRATSATRSSTTCSRGMGLAIGYGVARRSP